MSVAAVELALGVEALDAGVEVGLLILVDPFWWCPFGQPVGVDAAGPAFLEEVGVVVSAEQSQVVQVGGSAQDPVEDVMPVAPTCRVGAAGKGAAAVPSGQRQSLAFGG